MQNDLITYPELVDLNLEMVQLKLLKVIINVLVVNVLPFVCVQFYVPQQLERQ